MNIAIAGFGNMGKVHAFCIESLKYFYDDVSFFPGVIGVSASDYMNAQCYASKYGFEKAYRSFDDLISDPDVDVVDICTPNKYHFEMLRGAINSGKNIYCEKPLCISYSEASEILSLAKKKSIFCSIVFNTRFLLPVIRAKEIIQSGKIGRILSFDFSFLHSSAMNTEKTGWKQDRDICGGGVLFDLGSHAVDLCRYLCGDFKSVTGKGVVAFAERTSYKGEPGWSTNADEGFFIRASLVNDSVGTIRVGKIFAGTNDDFSFEIFGSSGSLKFSLMEPNWLYYYSMSTPEETRGMTRIECVGRYPAPASGFPGLKAPVGWLRGHIGSMYNYLSNTAKGIQAEPSFEDAVYVQYILEKAYESDTTGSTVFI